MKSKRTRIWRIHKDKVNKKKGMGTGEKFKSEKNWKLICLRSEKLARAKQLGFPYPRKSVRQLLGNEDHNCEY